MNPDETPDAPDATPDTVPDAPTDVVDNSPTDTVPDAPTDVADNSPHAVFRAYQEHYNDRNATDEAVFRGYTDGRDNTHPLGPDSPEAAPAPDTDTEGTSDDGQHDGDGSDDSGADSGSPA